VVVVEVVVVVVVVVVVMVAGVSDQVKQTWCQFKAAHA
jgi:Flp pilus assembly pilin Flp